MFTDKASLPNYPRILLDSDMNDFLESELTTPELNTFYPYLWLAGTQSSSHVTPLSEQASRGRSIIISENPEFHLLSVSNRIYLKPIPKFLFSHAFWEYLVLKKDLSSAEKEKRKQIGDAARGFLRTWAYLIRHKSDFIVAQRLVLISTKFKYSKFVAFIDKFERVLDQDVSLRYSYGELRLGRLNLWARIALGRPQFHKIVRNYGDYFAQYYAPILFIFGAFSIVLSAMQVALAKQQTQSLGAWGTFTDVCLDFSIFSLLVVILLLCFIIVPFFYRAVDELIFALRANYRKRKRQTNDGENGSYH